MTLESRKLWFAGNIDTCWVRWCLLSQVTLCVILMKNMRHGVGWSRKVGGLLLLSRLIPCAQERVSTTSNASTCNLQRE